MCITRRKQTVPKLPDQHLSESYHLQPPLAHHPSYHHYKQTSLQKRDSNSIFTIEKGSMNVPIGSIYTDSEPLYQEIGKRIKHDRDGCDNVRNMYDKTVSDRVCDPRVNCNERDEYRLKACEKAKMTTKPNIPKPNIAYGGGKIQALYSGSYSQARNDTVMVAKYRPCIQDIMLRPGIAQ
jgi:hypothetical protein